MGRLAGDPLKVSVTIMAEGVVAVECNRCGALVCSESRQESLNFSKAHVVSHGATPKVTKDESWPK